MSISLFYRSMNTILICTHSNLDSEDSILDQRCLPFPPAHFAPKFSEFLVKRSRNFRRLLICQKKPLRVFRFLVEAFFYVDPVYYLQDLQIPSFSNFFFKIGSYGTNHTFKNYFATIFSVFSFSFQQ